MSPEPSFLATRRGKLTLAFLCGVAFLDFVDASIVNVALPSIQHSLHFSIQSLQWVLSGYLLTYGGFMLLGGRAADLIGRRRVLVAGTVAVRPRLADRRPRRKRGNADRGAPGPGDRSGDDDPRGALDPDHVVQRGQRPQHGDRRLGRDGRPGLRAGRVPRRRDLPGAGLALGVLREPSGLRARPDRGLPAGRRRTASAAPGPLRRARGAAGDHRDAAA